MEQLVSSFFAVFFFPVNPEFLNFENNPIMVFLSMNLLGIGIYHIFTRLYYGAFNLS